MTKAFSRRWLHVLSSVEVTLSCILLALALVAAGTLAQIRLGTFEAQKQFFDSWWITTWMGNWKAPVFPGGLTVGSLWLISLSAAFFTRFEWKRKEAGLIVTHAGLIALLLGQLLTQLFAHESQLPIPVGTTRNYSENLREFELAVIRTSDPLYDEVTSIPEAAMRHRPSIVRTNWPFTLVIRKFMPNAQLTMAIEGQPGIASQGIGTRILAREQPVHSSDEEPNTVTALVEIKQGDKSGGTWLLSSGLGAPQSFSMNGETYQLFLRPRRTYYPFSITLNQFTHDIYPGTDIPKNFASHVRLTNTSTGESRDSLIYMNHPLRYQGKTFYQASFAENDTVSILQVVDNPVVQSPYIACAIVSAGLVIQFLMHLMAFARRRT
jgi:hypothetical protein